jgi:hypothetical protein
MRFCLCFLAMAVVLAAAAEHPGYTVETLRGKLSVRAGQPPTVETADHKIVQLEGDETTSKVLADKRLDGFHVEAKGHFTSGGHFQIEPSHTHPFEVRKDGKLKLVSYWCGVCSIRQYTPGPCPCCQAEMTLELIDPGSQ